MFPGYHVRAITNGVHTATWAHPAFANVYNAHFPGWPHEPEVLIHTDELSDVEIWSAHMAAKADILRLIQDACGVRMSPDIPLFGFARRMTAYKRPELIFRDIERLKKIHGKQPFQVVLAGKAHPRDLAGKALIEELNQHVKILHGAINIAYLPNYDLDIAAHLISGCDVWLNTPLAPMEASGTSGMKAAINGVLNMSVLDGWWLEAWIEGTTGWAIGSNPPTQENERDADDFYDKLEHTVLPLYYQNRIRWIWMMKQSIGKIASYFNSQRMMRRYATEAYLR
jgi:starch phosphorylase